MTDFNRQQLRSWTRTIVFIGLISTVCAAMFLGAENIKERAFALVADVTMLAAALYYRTTGTKEDGK